MRTTPGTDSLVPRGFNRLLRKPARCDEQRMRRSTPWRSRRERIDLRPTDNVSLRISSRLEHRQAHPRCRRWSREVGRGRPCSPKLARYVVDQDDRRRFDRDRDQWSSSTPLWSPVASVEEGRTPCRGGAQSPTGIGGARRGQVGSLHHRARRRAPTASQRPLCEAVGDEPAESSSRGRVGPAALLPLPTSARSLPAPSPSRLEA
jgi:hypothetical protein